MRHGTAPVSDITAGLGSLGHKPRILIVRLGAIGDVVNALVVANSLRHHLPEVTIGWATHPLSQSMVVGHPSVDRVHVWPKGTGLKGFRAIVKEVRAAKYDIALDLQRLQKSALLARFSGARRVIGFDRQRSKEQSWLWTGERIATGHRREHMVFQYQRFLDVLGLPREPLLRGLVEDPASAAWASEFLDGACGGSAPILFNIGASKEDKRWPEASFRAVAESFLEGFPGVPLVVTGGPSDVPIAESLQRSVPALHQLAGRTSLPQLIALIRRSRGMLTGDTGAMHMAAALDVPTIALFGPSDPIRTGPFGAGHLVLQGPELPLTNGPDGPSRPYPATRFRCPMAETTPETVSIQAQAVFLPR